MCEGTTAGSQQYQDIVIHEPRLNRYQHCAKNDLRVVSEAVAISTNTTQTRLQHD